jgi:aarF domain-containing kinase
MTPSERSYALHQRMRQGIRDILADVDKWPKELLFIGRNMSIVHANNQFFGSPVNRLKMMGDWAGSSLYQDIQLPWGHRISNAFRHFVFRMVLAACDLSFYVFMVRSWLSLGGSVDDATKKHPRDMDIKDGAEM